MAKDYKIEFKKNAGKGETIILPNAAWMGVRFPVVSVTSSRQSRAVERERY